MTDHLDQWDDNPEWTQEDFQRARPTTDVLGAAIASALTRPAGPARGPSLRRHLMDGARFERIVIMREISTLGRSLGFPHTAAR